MRPGRLTVSSVAAGSRQRECEARLTGWRQDVAEIGGRLGQEVVVVAPPSARADATQRDRLLRITLLVLDRGWTPGRVTLAPQSHTTLPEVEIDEAEFIEWFADLDAEDRPEIHRQSGRAWAEAPGREVVVLAFLDERGFRELDEVLEDGEAT